MFGPDLRTSAEWEKLINLILEEVKSDLRGRGPVYATDEPSMWNDLYVEATVGLPSPLSELLIGHVEEVLMGTLSRLPVTVQDGLWWVTAEATGYLFDVAWAWKNDPSTLSDLAPPETIRSEDIVAHLRGLLLRKVESELDLE